MATAHQTIWTLVRALDRSTSKNGIAALDAAIRACSGYRSTQELVDEFVLKCNMHRGASLADIKHFLKRDCGIDLDNEDTGALIGRDANGGNIKTAENIVYEPQYSSVTNISSSYYGKTYNFNDTNKKYMVTAKLPTLVRGTEQEKAVITGLANWWIPQAASLVKDTFGLYFNKYQDSTDYLTPRIDFFLYYNDNTDAVAMTWSQSSRQPCVRVGINMSKFANFTLMKGYNVSGYKDNGTQYLDRILAHELTHAMFDLNVSSYINSTLPQFFKEGIAELVHGAEDIRRADIIDLVSGKSDIVRALDINDRGTLYGDSYAAGYMLLRYLAQQVKSGFKPPIITGLNHSADKTLLTVTSAYKGTTIDSYYVLVETIDARKSNRAVSILGNNNDNYIFANNKGDFLRGGYGNDVLYGGAGVDTFFSFGVEGNDTIYNYQSGKDIIRFGSADYGALTSATVEGSDVVLKVGTGSVTIKDGAGKYIKIMDGNNQVSYTRFVKGTANYDSETAHFFSNGDNNEAYTLYQTSVLGLVYNSNKTTLTAKKNCAWADNAYNTIDTNEFWWTLKSVNLSAAPQGHAVIGRESITSMTGSKYDDQLIAGGRTAVLKGGAGNDLLRGASVSSKLYGGTGNDEIYSESGTNYLYGEAGDDILGCLKGKSYLYGGAGNDTMYGGEGTNTLRGGNGNDNLTGGSGTNLLYGDAGNDTITGGSGLSKLYGGAGNDILTGGIDVNELYGGAGDDELHGGNDTNGSYLLKGEAGNDTIIGGAGSNTIWGGAGKDTLTGGTGKNTYYFASLGEMAGDTITNLKGSDTLYFNLKKAALDLDAIYQNYNLGQTTGKNTISLEGETLTITDKNKRKYTMTIAGGFSGSMTLQNSSKQQQTFKL